MKILLSCVGGSAQYVPGGGRKIEVPVEAGDTVAGVLARLRLSEDLFMFTLVNGERVEPDHRFTDGDDVVLVSALSGG